MATRAERILGIGEKIGGVAISSWDLVSNLSQRAHLGKRALTLITLGVVDIAISLTVHHFDRPAAPTLKDAFTIGTTATSYLY